MAFGNPSITGSYLENTTAADLPTDPADWSCSFWFLMEADADASTCLFSFGDDTVDGVMGLYTASNGTTLRWYVGGNQTDFGELTPDVWYHVQINVSGTGLGEAQCWIDGTDISEDGDSTVTSTELVFFNWTSLYNQASEWPGYIEGFKLWDTAIGKAALDLEKHTITAKRKADLLMNLSFWDHDLAGTGAIMTKQGGTGLLDTQVLPEIPFSGAPLPFQPTVQSSSDTLVVQALDFAFTVDSPSLSSETDLVVNDADFGFTLDNISLVEIASLVVSDLAFAFTTDVVSLTSDDSLVLQGIDFSFTVDSPTLTTDVSLTVNDVDISFTIDNLTLVSSTLGTLTVPVLTNNAGSVEASVSSINYFVYSADMTTRIAEGTTGATDGSGNLIITDASVVASTDYWLFYFENLTDTGKRGSRRLTAT